MDRDLKIKSDEILSHKLSTVQTNRLTTETSVHQAGSGSGVCTHHEVAEDDSHPRLFLPVQAKLIRFVFICTYITHELTVSVFADGFQWQRLLPVVL